MQGRSETIGATGGLAGRVAIVFLASTDSDAMTGQLLAVDRGTAFTG